MATSGNLVLETQEQHTVILAKPSQLIKKVASELSALGSEISLITLDNQQVDWARTIFPDQALQTLNNLSIDFFIVYQDEALNTWLRQEPNQPLFKKLLTDLDVTKTFHVIEDSSRTKIEIMDSITIKLEELYGNGKDSNSLWEFTKSAIEEGKITIPGDGLDSIRPLHVKDAPKAILRSILDPYLDAKEIVISGPDAISYMNLAYKIRSLIPQKTTLEFTSQQPQAILLGERLANISDWQPQHNLDENLENYVKSITKNFKKPEPTTKAAPPETPSQETSVEEAKTPTTPQAPQENKETIKPEPSSQSSQKPKLTPLIKEDEELSDLEKKRREIEFVKLDVKMPPFKRIISKLKKRQPKQPKKKKKQTSREKSRTQKIIFRALVAIFIYTSTLIISGFITLRAVKKVSSAVAQNPSLPKVSKIELYSSSYLDSNISFISSLPLINKLKPAQELALLTSTSESSLIIINKASSTAVLVDSLASHILGEEQIQVQQTLNKLKTELDTLYKDLSLLEGSLPASPPSILPARFNSSYTTLRSALTELRQTTLAASALINISPDLLGVGDSRKYAILLQNNMEIRPTGGFIGSFAILEFEDAELFNLQVYDVYQADGQLKGYVEPPEAIEEYLGESNWYLRDSNWDPDFPTSAKRASWFIDKTIEEEVDGVIGINLFTIQDILNATGPVSLPDYEEEITAENLFEKAEYHSEVDFFPGSTQKKEFLASLTDTLFTKLVTLTPEESLRLASAVFTSLKQKNTTISLENLNSEAVLSKLSWNGEVINPNCPTQRSDSNSCLQDYLFIVDSNFGINKVNYFIKRSIDLDSTINADRSVKNKLTLTYTNTATSGSWPAGNYTNYQRVYLPLGTDITSLTIDGVEVEESDIKTSIEHSKTMLEYLVVTPIKQTTTTVIEYELKDKLPQEQPTYSLYWQKQPGTSEDPLNIHVNYPLYLTPSLISPEAVTDTQQVNFTLKNSHDRVVVVSF